MQSVGIEDGKLSSLNLPLLNFRSSFVEFKSTFALQTYANDVASQPYANDVALQTYANYVALQTYANDVVTQLDKSESLR